MNANKPKTKAKASSRRHPAAAPRPSGARGAASKEEQSKSGVPSEAVIVPETASIPQNKKRLEPGIHTLRDAAGEPLVTLTFLGDNPTLVEPTQKLLTAMISSVYKAEPEATELSRALCHLAKLSLEDVRTLFENLLPHVASTAEMTGLACCMEAMTKHLGNHLRVLVDDEKPRKAREDAAESILELFSESVDVLLNGAGRKPHGSAKQLFDATARSGEVVKMPWELAAIQEIMKFAGVEHQLPTMIKLRERMKERLGIEIDPQRLGEVLAKIGVKLRKGPPTYRKQSKPRPLPLDLGKALRALKRETNSGKLA